VAVKSLHNNPESDVDDEVWVYLFVLCSDVPKRLEGTVERDRYLEENVP
jgi:hypothetical protein